MKRNKIDIIDYQPSHQVFFEALNRQWIEQYFRMEAIDRFVLEDPDKAILQRGGFILMAVVNQQVAGTVALKKLDARTFEMTKMAVAENQRGKGIGEALGRAAIEKARSLHADRVVLYSHTSLNPAISLYQKLGFRETRLEQGGYARADIKMEIWLGYAEVIGADITHAHIIADIGRRSFQDAFARYFNRQEDLWEYLEFTYRPEKIAASLSRPNNAFFLCLYNQRPVGFAKIKKQSPNKKIPADRQMELQKIYLLQEYHGTGAAPALLKAVLDLAEDIRPDYLWLDVLIQNARAIRFYEKNGFAKWAKHFFVIGSQRFEYDVMLLPVNSTALPDEISLQTDRCGNW